MKLDKKLQGFSLIELLVVVAIIGILAAVGTVGYSNYMNSTKSRVTISNAESVQSGLKTLAAASDTGAGCDSWATCYEEVKKDITKNPYSSTGAVIVDLSATTLTEAAPRQSAAGTACGTQTSGPLNFGQIGVLRSGTIITVIYCAQSTTTPANYEVVALPQFDFGK